MKNGILLQLILALAIPLIAQKPEKQNFRVMCYNVDNFFDCVHDSLTNDSEFLPSGIRGWNTSKYEKKQAHIAKVIAAIGGWNAPVLVGLCEVESDKCLTDLTHYSGLKSFRYKYIHYDSPDPRGIDVALLYQPNQFKPIHQEAIRIHFPHASEYKTRDVLFVSGQIPTGDTLHVFLCHLPSRLNGELESEDKRIFVASVIRSKVDSLFAANRHPKIIIMGDFNDLPTNSSMSEVLKAKPLTGSISARDLYNLMYKMQLERKGSNKYRGEWSALDQIIVSGNLLDSSSSFFTLQNDAHFFDAGFLLENDKAYLGKQPFRTYVGLKYHDGYSDHLPAYADFWY
ncbi:MAG: endonuclease [Bacteroidota bacterium]|nr:endonuclease [Bacteroidota bacterium]